MSTEILKTAALVMAGTTLEMLNTKVAKMSRRIEEQNAEIADLRAQLARQSQGEAVGIIVGNHPVHGWHMKELKPWNEIGDGTKLYAAPPLSSEPQGDA